MTQRRRRQLGRGYTEEFNLLEAGVSSLDLSMRLEAIWSSPGRGQDLDDLLSDLGNAYVEEDRVMWDPPPDLDPAFANYLSRSVEELNSHFQAGILTIDEDGNIRPIVGPGPPDQPTRATRQWRR